MAEDDSKGRYTCNDYREEMILVQLRRQLQREGLSEEERLRLRREIEQLEQKMGL